MILGTTLAKDHGNTINSPDIHRQNDSITKTNSKKKGRGPAVLGLAVFYVVLIIKIFAETPCFVYNYIW